MNEEVDVLVPRSQVAREFNVVPRTIVRWELQGLHGLHEPVVINRHVYHRRSGIELAKLGRKTAVA